MHRADLNKTRLARIVPPRALVLLAVFVFALGGDCFGQKKQKLEKNYRDWLEHDVAYIITKDERDTFLRLTTDEARDKFIADFWEIRNPNPDSPSNSYKDEIYERIAFANARFGAESGGEGWRTDRGRTYIILGAAAANCRRLSLRGNCAATGQSFDGAVAALGGNLLDGQSKRPGNLRDFSWQGENAPQTGRCTFNVR